MSPTNRWLLLAWLTQLAVHWTPRAMALWPELNRQAREAFYILQGVQSVTLLLFLAAIVGARLTRRQSLVLFLLVVYGAAEQGLVAICGVGYYFMTPPEVVVNTAMPLCSRGSAWWWMPIFLAFIALMVRCEN